jgi:chorismate mutase
MPALTQRLRGVIRMTPGRAARPKQPKQAPPSASGAFGAAARRTDLVDLQRRRDQLNARVAELQWDLGGLVYEMAIRDRIRVDVLVRRAAELQSADAELSEVERILRLEETSTAGECASCGAPHSTGAVYCWQCGQPLLKEVHSDAIGA